MINWTKEEIAELKRLLYVSIMQEADRMNKQSIINAIALITKLEEHDLLQDTEDKRSDQPIHAG